MSLYRKLLLEKIRKGEKTRTTRPIEPKPGRSVYSVGQIIGVRAGYTKFKDFVKITARHRERLGDLTQEDAKKDGFSSLEEFQKFWTDLYGWNPDQVVWVYDFELAKKDSTSKDKPFSQATDPSKLQ